MQDDLSSSGSARAGTVFGEAVVVVPREAARILVGEVTASDQDIQEVSGRSGFHL